MVGAPYGTQDWLRVYIVEVSGSGLVKPLYCSVSGVELSSIECVHENV